jgi:hypothetical protein
VYEQFRGEARLLTPTDLSTPYWRLPWRDAAGARGCAGGTVFESTQINCVLSLLPVVTSFELPHIAADDRDYVAAEMHALLYFWLHELACPVLNRPRDGILSGLAWSAARWRWHAQRAGLPVHADGRRAERVQSINLVGDRLLGDVVSPSLARGVRNLARGAEVQLMHVVLANGCFAAAQTRPLLTDPAVAGAVGELLKRGGR